MVMLFYSSQMPIFIYGLLTKLTHKDLLMYWNNK